MSNFLKQSAQKGFTLIELIIVITILVILGVVVVVLIDPAEILAQSRDSQRISDLAAIKGATQLILASGVPATGSCGSTQPINASSSMWISMPSTAGGSAYSSTTEALSTLADGTGWIKVNYASSTTGRAFSNLPIDPTNTIAGSLSYRWGCTYIGSIYEYEVDATLESAKYKPGCTASGCDNKSAKDGGNSTTRYEVGNNLNVLPATF
mgnify:CR=1 FL=1